MNGSKNSETFNSTKSILGGNATEVSVSASSITEWRINYCLRRVKDYRTKAENSRENARKYPYNARYHHKKAIEYDKEADEWQKGANELQNK